MTNPILDAPSTSSEAAAIVADASLALAFGGLRDLVWGHASVRDPDGRGVWMKAAGWGFEEITPERVQLVSWDGEVLEGTGARHIEYLIHTSVYRARPDVGGVVHAHSDRVNAWCALGTPLEPLTHAGTVFASGLPRFTETANIIRSAEVGGRLARALGDRDAIVIPHHGFVTCGRTVGEAVVRAVMLERAAGVQLAAHAAGEVVSRIRDDELSDFAWPGEHLQSAWRYLVRQGRRSFLDVDPVAAAPLARPAAPPR